jgi:hypothetical protein
MQKEDIIKQRVENEHRWHVIARKGSANKAC